MNDMTVSLISSRHPRELFRKLEEQGCGVEEKEPGIYEAEGYPLPVQIIETRRLDVKENLWLSGLRPGLQRDIIGEILDEGGKREGEKLGAYLHAVMESNPEVVEEVLEMRKKKLTLHDVLEKSGLTAEWERRGEVRGEALGEKTAWEKAISLLKQGYTVEQLEQMDPVNAPLSTNP
jgi:hypothetical protein